MNRIEVRRIHLLAMDADVVMIAADERLRPEGRSFGAFEASEAFQATGASAAVHASAGPELAEACRSIGSCPTGSARITRGYRLEARSVVHVVGPRWTGGGAGEADLFARALTDGLHLVVDHGGGSVALPAIGCGAWGFPPERAAAIAIEAIWRAIAPVPAIQRVTFCIMQPEVHDAYRRALEDERTRLLAGAF